MAPTLGAACITQEQGFTDLCANRCRDLRGRPGSEHISEPNSTHFLRTIMIHMHCINADSTLLLHLPSFVFSTMHLCMHHSIHIDTGVVQYSIMLPLEIPPP